MDWLFNFPKVFDFDTTSIDDAVRSFAVSASGVLDAIKGFLNSFVVGLQTGLSHIPWVVLILLVVLLGWKVRGKLRSGALYGILLFLIGAVGLWDLMLMTLSVVLASVIIALIIGIPIGILISGSERANKIVRPILDTMQTMPVFVYLIPALLLFGTGNASGVIATVIYAVVPVIRLTSLGIRQVDKEHLVETAMPDSGSVQTVETIGHTYNKDIFLDAVIKLNKPLSYLASQILTSFHVAFWEVGINLIHQQQTSSVVLFRFFLCFLKQVTNKSLCAMDINRTKVGWIHKERIHARFFGQAI